VHASADKTLRIVDYDTEYYTDVFTFVKAAEDAGTSLSALEAGIQNKYGPIPDERARAYAIRQAAKMYNIKIHAEEQYSFFSTSSLVLWLIGNVARANQRISICPVCGHYFHRKRINQKYCSPSCREDNMNSSAFHGEKEIALAYRRNHTLFSSKANRSKEKKIPYFIPAIKDQENATDETYDIAVEKRKYEGSNTLRLAAFNSAYDELQQNPSRETKEAYDQQKESYLNWLNEQHKFIMSLRLDREGTLE